jgi:Mor family transcriptional regulator
LNHTSSQSKFSNKPVHRLPLVGQMTDILRDRLALQDPWATAMAQEIVQGLSAKFGGALVYVPCPDRKARDERIRQVFNGTNLQEVCDQFGLSRTAVYRICSRRK